STNADLEIEILRSRAVMETVVRELNLVYKYSIQGRVKWVELYDRLPFTFQQFGGDTLKRKETYRIRFKDKSNYVVKIDDVELEGLIGDTLAVRNVKVLVMPGLGEIGTKEEYMVEVFPFDKMVSMMMASATAQ